MLFSTAATTRGQPAATEACRRAAGQPGTPWRCGRPARAAPAFLHRLAVVRHNERRRRRKRKEQNEQERHPFLESKSNSQHGSAMISCFYSFIHSFIHRLIDCFVHSSSSSSAGQSASERWTVVGGSCCTGVGGHGGVVSERWEGCAPAMAVRAL